MAALIDCDTGPNVFPALGDVPIRRAKELTNKAVQFAAKFPTITARKG